MSAPHLTLTQREPTRFRLDMSAFTPERLAGLTTGEVAQLPIQVGNQSEPAGELFNVSGAPGERLVIQPAATNLDRLGDGMSQGELRIEGTAGDAAGLAMSGGLLHIDGDAGDEAGNGMRGGQLRIVGNAGERLGGPPPGSTRGISGGLIHVSGDAGDRAGERMRRGTLLIEGSTGDWCAANLIAGTIAVLGNTGRMTGSGMRRGTVLLSRRPDGLPPTFVDNGVQRPGFLGLLLPSLARLADLGAWAETPGGTTPKARRLLGDLSDGGLGEVLVLSSEF